jgi:hypothetical protein
MESVCAGHVGVAIKIARIQKIFVFNASVRSKAFRGELVHSKIFLDQYRRV